MNRATKPTKCFFSFWVHYWFWQPKVTFRTNAAAQLTHLCGPVTECCERAAHRLVLRHIRCPASGRAAAQLISLSDGWHGSAFMMSSSHMPMGVDGRPGDRCLWVRTFVNSSVNTAAMSARPWLTVTTRRSRVYREPFIAQSILKIVKNEIKFNNLNKNMNYLNNIFLTTPKIKT